MIQSRYALTETQSWKYPVRTRKNIEDTAATLVLARGDLTGGTALTTRIAAEIRRPLLVLDLNDDDAVDQADQWLRLVCPRTLNVAGPRESSDPGVYDATRTFLIELLADDPLLN